MRLPGAERGASGAGAPPGAERRLRLNPRGRWGRWADHPPARPLRRPWQLALGLFLVLGIIMGLEGYVQRRRKGAPEDSLRVLHLSPAPEAALPLMPFPGAAPDAEVEFRALLMRIPADRQTPPALLSVHTLSGRMDAPVTGRVGARGEYEVSFTPRRASSPRQIVLAGFRFAPVSAPRGARGRPAAGPDVALDLEVPRRIDPPMEPEEGAALVLQITGRLSGRPPRDQ